MNLLRVTALAAIWCILTRDASLPAIASGLAISALLVRAVGRGDGRRRPARRPRPLRRVLRFLELAGFFLLELIVSNVRIALLVLRPRLELRPMILHIPVETQSDEELALLSDLVTLTPGTLTLDVVDDGAALLVHVLPTQDPFEIERGIREGLGRRVRRLFE